MRIVRSFNKQGGLTGEYVVLTPNERRLSLYLTAVVGMTVLVLEGLAAATLDAGTWLGEILGLVSIILIVIPLTCAGFFCVGRHLFLTQNQRIAVEHEKGRREVVRFNEEKELRHNARKALVTAAENGVYDAVKRNVPADVRHLQILERASAEIWEDE